METIETIETKKCIKCGKELPLSEFYANYRNRGGVDTYCKDCRKQTTKETYRYKKLNTPPCDPARFNGLDIPKKHYHEIEALDRISSNILIYALRARGYKGELSMITKVKI